MLPICGEGRTRTRREHSRTLEMVLRYEVIEERLKELDQILQELKEEE